MGRGQLSGPKRQHGAVREMAEKSCRRCDQKGDASWTGKKLVITRSNQIRKVWLTGRFESQEISRSEYGENDSKTSGRRNASFRPPTLSVPR